MARGRRRKRHAPFSIVPLLCVVAFLGVISLQHYALQIGLATLALAAAVVFAYVHRSRRRYQRWANLEDIRVLTPKQFEEHVAEFYRQHGYRVRLTPAIGDQGVDVIAEGNGRRLAIQCKLYSSNVSNDAVQQVLAGMHYYSCNHAVVISSSGFTASAIELAKRSKVQLINGLQYAELLRLLKRRDATAGDSAANSDSDQQAASGAATAIG